MEANETYSSQADMKTRKSHAKLKYQLKILLQIKNKLKELFKWNITLNIALNENSYCIDELLL